MIEGSKRTLRLGRLRRPLSRFPWRIVPRERAYPRAHDRYVLEDVIFPALLSNPQCRDILFVGCDTYTAHYPDLFIDRNFMTIDIDPVQARHGAARHVVDTFTNTRAHFDAASLDAVVCNGVIGWGLNRPEEIDRAAKECFECLHPGGIFIVGSDNAPPWRPVAFDNLDGFRKFEPLTLPPFPGPVYPTFGEFPHIFNFYVRPKPEEK